jgi:hypothetical protein
MKRDTCKRCRAVAEDVVEPVEYRGLSVAQATHLAVT